MIGVGFFFFLRLLRFEAFGMSDEVDHVPVAEGEQGRGGGGGALAVVFLQLAVVAEERRDQDADDDAHGQQDEEGRKARRWQAHAVDDVFAHFALEDGDAFGGAGVGREGQVDGRDDLVAGDDAHVGAAHVAFVEGVTSLARFNALGVRRRLFGIFLSVGDVNQIPVFF